MARASNITLERILGSRCSPSAAQRDRSTEKYQEKTLMLHPAVQTVEQYYSLSNRKDWTGLADMLDLPATVRIGPRKVLLDKPDAVTALYQAVEPDGR